MIKTSQCTGLLQKQKQAISHSEKSVRSWYKIWIETANDKWQRSYRKQALMLEELYKKLSKQVCVSHYTAQISLKNTSEVNWHGQWKEYRRWVAFIIS